MYSTVEFLSPVQITLHQDLPGSIISILSSIQVYLLGSIRTYQAPSGSIYLLVRFVSKGCVCLCYVSDPWVMCTCQSVLPCVCLVLCCDCLLKEPFVWNNMSVLNPVPASTVNLPQFVWSCKALDSRTSCLTCVTQGTLGPKWVNVCVCVCAYGP